MKHKDTKPVVLPFKQNEHCDKMEYGLFQTPENHCPVTTNKRMWTAVHKLKEPAKLPSYENHKIMSFSNSCGVVVTAKEQTDHTRTHKLVFHYSSRETQKKALSNTKPSIAQIPVPEAAASTCFTTVLTLENMYPGTQCNITD